MPKHFELPDPNDRTVNSPLVLLSGELVLGLCNLHAQLKEIKDGKTVNGITRLNESIKNWFILEMEARGWCSVEFFGNQCLLRADVKVHVHSPK